MECVRIADQSDRGYHMFEKQITIAIQNITWTLDYPDPQAHYEFNSLITKAKEL